MNVNRYTHRKRSTAKEICMHRYLISFGGSVCICSISFRHDLCSYFPVKMPMLPLNPTTRHDVNKPVFPSFAASEKGCQSEKIMPVLVLFPTTQHDVGISLVANPHNNTPVILASIQNMSVFLSWPTPQSHGQPPQQEICQRSPHAISIQK